MLTIMSKRDEWELTDQDVYVFPCETCHEPLLPNQMLVALGWEEPELGMLFRVYHKSCEHPAWYLANVGCSFQLNQPAEQTFLVVL